MNILGMNIDWFKLMILLVIGLIVVGPEKLPSYARKTARFIRNFEKVIKSLSGEFSKALDLDDEEGGKTPSFKKDLIDIKKSLEEDVAGLKSALDSQAKTISDTVESGTSEVVANLKKNAKEISDTLNTQTSKTKTPPDAGVKASSTTPTAGLNDNVSSHETVPEIASQSEGIAHEAADKSVLEAIAESPPPIPSPVSETQQE